MRSNGGDEVGTTIDKVSPGTLEERITQIIRDNTNGPAAMDLTNLGKGEQAAEEGALEAADCLGTAERSRRGLHS